MSTLLPEQIESEQIKSEQIESEQMKSWLERISSLFQSGVPQAVRRFQYVWAGGILLILLLVSYGIVLVFFDKEGEFEADKKPEPLLIETSSNKVNLNEVRYLNLEEKNKKLSKDIKDLKESFQDTVRDKGEDTSSTIQNLEERITQLETQVVEQSQLSASAKSSSPSLPDQEKNLIQKHTLSLSENPKLKQLKTVDTTIPAGAFAKTILLSGLDASASMTASSDPRPMLLRVVDPGTLPRRFQSDLKDCHCTAGAYGDLSSERVYARLEKLTCIDRKTGEILETQVAGYIAGSDGKAGIRGVVASKDGQFLSRSLMGGIFAGLSNVANPQNRQAQVNPFMGAFPGSPQVSPPSVGTMFASGMAQGATTALDRLSQYYIDRAEQLQPVIQVDAGQVVDIVFTEGVQLAELNSIQYPAAFGSTQYPVSGIQSSDQYSVSSVQKEERKE